MKKPIISLMLLVITQVYSNGTPIPLRAPWTNGDWWRPATYEGHSPHQNCIDFNKVSASSVSDTWPYGTEVPAEDVNAPILAAHSGTAYRKVQKDANGNLTGYGYYVDVVSDENATCFTRYAHLNSYVAIDGHHVNAGEEIGKCGGSGGWPVHLHFELRQNNIVIPVDEIDGQPIQIDTSKTVGTPPNDYWVGHPIKAIGKRNEVWLQFGCGGSHLGTQANPFANWTSAIEALADNGKLRIITGIGAIAPITIDKPMTIQAEGGPVTIGQ